MEKENKRDTLFTNSYDRVFSVRLQWNISQPFVCGQLQHVVEYALQPNNGIEAFYELTDCKLKKVSKKELKRLLVNLPELSNALFKKY